MKKLVSVITLSAAFAMPSFADEMQDSDQIFDMDNASFVSVSLLSNEEMIETEGEWIPNAIGGGIGFFSGNYSYLVNAAFDQNAQWSWGSYARTVGASTVVGAINPVSSVGTAARALGSSFITAWGFR